jgi:hypothetical protein
VRIAATLLIGVAVSLAAVLMGAWWAPFTVGLVVGVIGRRARSAVALGAAIGLLAWLLPLVASHVRYDLGPAAQSLAAIMGFGRQGALPVALTLMVGLLLGLCGAWLGSAGRRLAVPTSR